ncbi:hypothetical protein F2Q70_00002646 [Brassica cretica]|uniref:Uncharacterized protein n=2 Tax=Brassica cretica TaxID=69181 RepID=A0A3N6QWI6_BRACR|nr:hypothetical protein F2Q68_00020596 [Brassica cretica]KAF2572786.1 hypothetical protein F2Q70_00002646 [Brassica cretica]KAF3562619.1 hypothetical protein DY000_02014221 [Brassica cretica]
MGAKVEQLGEIGSLVHDSPKSSFSKEKSLEIENVPEDKAPEPSDKPSVLVLDKRVSTVSDIQQGKTRRQKKNDTTMVYFSGKSERARKLAASQQSPFKGNNTAKLIIPNKSVGPGCDPFAPVDKKISKVLTD